MNEGELITPAEVRQRHYCSRVIFFERCTPVHRRQTILMKEGTERYLLEVDKEKRRNLSRFEKISGHTIAGEKQFAVKLVAPELGISGELDLLIVTAQEAYPVEFKHSSRPPTEGHKLQLCAYAFLIEEALNKSAPHGYWYSSKTRQLHQIEFTVRLRNKTRRYIDDLRHMLKDEVFPAPPTNTSKCLECELKNFCGDTV